MPTYDELDLTGMQIEAAKWTGPVLRASYGGGYGDLALVDNAAGLHLWTLRQANLFGSVSFAPLSGQSRFDYYWEFYKAHTTGAVEIFIVTWRTKKYHASFVDPSMDASQLAFGLFSPEVFRANGVKITQRRVAGVGYNADGSIDETPPTVPAGLHISAHTSSSLTPAWSASTDP